MKILLEVEAPGWDGNCPAELPAALEIQAFIASIIRSRSGRDAKITCIVLGDDYVVVDADALLRLQKKARLKI